MPDQQQEPAIGASLNARVVVSPQQLQEMMEQTAGSAVDQFSQRLWASSSATAIALDFAVGFVLYTESMSVCLRAVSWFGGLHVAVFIFCAHTGEWTGWSHSVLRLLARRKRLLGGCRRGKSM